MVKHIAGLDAEVIRKRSGEILKLSANLVLKLEANLRQGIAAAYFHLVAPVLKAQPIPATVSVRKSATRDEHAIAPERP